jgi:cobalt-precorrin-7 (C5)-methyltransferase
VNEYNITIISVGPGAKDLITVRGSNAINDCDVIVGFKEAVETFAMHKDHFIPEKVLNGTIDFVRKNKDKKIGILVSGDAGFFSLAKTIISEFGRDCVEVIPGVSSVSAGFAQIKNAWQDFRFRSAHGRDGEIGNISENTVVLCDKNNTPEKILAENPELDSDFEITVMKDISLENEQIFYDTPEEYDSSRILLVLERKDK